MKNAAQIRVFFISNSDSKRSVRWGELYLLVRHEELAFKTVNGLMDYIKCLESLYMIETNQLHPSRCEQEARD